MRVSSWLCGRKGNRRFRTVFIPFRRERESGCRRGPRNWGRGFLSIICPYRRSGTSDEQKRLHFGGAFFVISKHRANQIFHKFTLLTWLQQILILGDSSQCTQQPPHGASLYPFFIHTRKKRTRILSLSYPQRESPYRLSPVRAWKNWWDVRGSNLRLSA